MSRNHHTLKLRTSFFQAKERGVKPWEIRSNVDRTFKVGDMVTFQEIGDEDGIATGRILGPFEILYLTTGEGSGLLQPFTCAFTHST